MCINLHEIVITYACGGGLGILCLMKLLIAEVHRLSIEGKRSGENTGTRGESSCDHLMLRILFNFFLSKITHTICNSQND